MITSPDRNPDPGFEVITSRSESRLWQFEVITSRSESRLRQFEVITSRRRKPDLAV